jgi:hypothetical protein
MIFSKFVKKLQLPKAFKEAADEVYGESSISLKPCPPGSMLPGDIVTFSYDGQFGSRRLLVVSTQKGSRGNYLSSRGNRLLCTYELEETLPGLTMVLNSFYKQRRTNYSRMRNTMDKVFGVTNFKTFNFSKIGTSFKVELI